MDERQLIRSARNGNIQDFNHLVVRFQDQVYRQAFYMLPDASLAELVAQDTFVQAFNHLHSYRGPSFRLWLLRLAIQRCLNRPGLHIERKPAAPLHHAGQFEKALTAPPSARRKTQLSAQSAGLHHLLHQQLQGLPPLDRAAIVLTEVQCLSCAEAAEVLQISENRFKAYLVQARKQLCLNLTQATRSCPATGLA